MSKKATVHRYIHLDEVDPLRDAAHDRDLRYDSLGRRIRDEVLIVLAIDLGLRAAELRGLKESMFRLNAEEVQIPGHVQKDYPNEDISPGSVTMRLDPYNHFGTVRLLKSYFNSEWHRERGSDYVFPSRQSDQMTTESMRNIVEDLAVHADTTVHRSDGESADPSELHPQALRHSLSNYMLGDPDTRLVDLRNRLRHRSISTTERVYEHFQRR
ncbi:integrase family protein [Haloferax elongans ATCC BAA-1513]|uniref:Integrase family protein n=1 Tax=Haloferax elongans ATCC BAA-1513 TaxID=1230453 RepID=M0HD85_HALEO|nr:tyrosine-type recombinase/integrase [Haloferax elongans]ELZ81773.1 integrase family protein [Haloferax elongans ATCC BAA-1513]